MSFLPDKLRTLCEQLYTLRTRDVGAPEGIEIAPGGYKLENNTPPAEGWRSFAQGEYIGGVDAHYWFRFEMDVPEESGLVSYFLRMTTGREGQWDARNPQALVYLDGEMCQGLDTNHTELRLTGGRHRFDVYYYCGMEPGECAVRFWLEALDTRVDKVYYDFLVPTRALTVLHSNSTEYARMMRVTERAADLVDLRCPGSEAFYASLAAACELLAAGLYRTPAAQEPDAPVVNCIGHTHIDVAWLWTYAQTMEKAQRSFATVLKLMEEYPEYKFMSSQPQLYAYVKQFAPEMYEGIRRRVKEGRWEVDGAMWLEADCNLISGESFVRQILQGKRFMQQEFGVDSRTLWLPDVFGYSAALPQILKKCGVDNFVTSKISWNETNCLPCDTFWWEGIDGTQVFTSFLTAQDMPADGKPTTGTTYVANTEPSMILGTWNRYQQKEFNNQTCLTFGFGDGGGGPTRHMLEMQRRLAAGLPGFPRTRMAFSGEWLAESRKNFEENSRRLNRTVRWVGELYLEYHRGTYTSQARNKKANRKTEYALQRAEAFCFADALLCGGDYPHSALYEGWRTVLLNQFHDVIPGSSIHQVYEDSQAMYRALNRELSGIQKAALEHIATQIHAPQGGILVYNPTGCAHGGPVQLGEVTVEVPEIPAWGWRVVEADALCEAAVRLGEDWVENACYRIELDGAGRITRLYDKRNHREVLQPGTTGNELQLFEDLPRAYDAWEISDYHRQKMWVLDTPARLESVTDGTRAGIRISRQYHNSRIEQTLWLYSENDRIDFETHLDWHEEHQLLKAAFPLDVHASRATYEIQFGSLERATHANTSWDAAKFEVCAHKWMDISEDGYGVSLMNDCKYGHSAEGAVVRLTLLKCATYPDETADKGEHTFTYSLLPHADGWRNAGTVGKALALNQPLIATVLPAQTGSLPADWSLVQCDAPSVLTDTVKRAEDSNDMIVRAYEAHDRRIPAAAFTFGFPVKRAALCDMLENELAELPVTDGCTVTLPVANFEIVTLKVTPEKPF